ncbi:uncharacterized protein BDCG_17015 [Blastomyces dermatitidis ER-3]|uniref:Uncharacterized protein n=1 Tax=Ajellomyces dermatitidis (strain ER-3 / ATCC MYA-2586) TaxID=559297 RepID=A0ABX2VVV5_AJEDR|nr:uncharacterized protein BDCG_17015 [Blastomyces dermatitidis ER-3]OAT01283.1 hypothetical protein BDCG_17015 [Blastomyces dermatitidis ER-3]
MLKGSRSDQNGGQDMLALTAVAKKQSHLDMSDTSVTSEFSSRLRITHFTRQLIDRMITYYKKAPDLQDEAEISFCQSMKFDDDETTEKLQNKEKQS